MKKDFDNWNIEKKNANNNKGRYYHEREVWWCTLGVNIGYEQDGLGRSFQRPVLVIKGLSSNTCVVAPLTTSESTHPMRISLGEINGKRAFVIISQLRVVDTRRFTERLHVLNKEIFDGVQKAVRKLF